MYTKERVPKPLYSEYDGFETACKFNRPTKGRRYVRTLALCLSYAPAALIYPGVRHPLMRQVRDMCRAGLLERFSKDGDRRYYYKTTAKGVSLLVDALKEVE